MPLSNSLRVLGLHLESARQVLPMGIDLTALRDCMVNGRLFPAQTQSESQSLWSHLALTSLEDPGSIAQCDLLQRNPDSLEDCLDENCQVSQ